MSNNHSDLHTYTQFALCLSANTVYTYDQTRHAEPTTGLVGRSSTHLKDEQEDVNDINIKRKCSIDVLLWADGQLPISNKKLGVVC